MLKISHISCRVSNLTDAADYIQKMGFTIEWGGEGKKSKNFFVWLGEGAFLEFFSINYYFLPLVIIVKCIYGNIASKKWWHWFTAKNEWCDFALEDDDERNTKIENNGKHIIVNIDSVKQRVLKMGIKVSKKTLNWKRKNCRGQYANYSYFIPENIKLPFIVSRYEPRQKQATVIHKNGAYKFAYIKIQVGKNEYMDMSKLTADDKNIILIKGNDTRILEIGIYGLKKDISVYNIILKAMEE